MPYLFIENRLEPHWKEANEEVYNDNSSVSVWRASVTALISSTENLQNLLQPQELEKAMRYRQENDQQQRIISKAVLRILLGRYLKVESQKIRFQQLKNRKPALYNLTDQLCFNVSHSGDWVLIAIAKHDLGIDVEQMDASFTYQNILSMSFSPPEISFINNSAFPRRSFYELWTRKESLLKATGTGLVDDLALIPALNGVHINPTAISGSTENWQINSIQVDENHVASVTFNPIKTELSFFNFQL
jgi:4'-phosphopantetheinyl transferase